MAVEVSDYVAVDEQAERLGCNVPTGLAILPRNFDLASTKEELLHESSTPTIRLLLREAGIYETRIEREGERFPRLEQKGLEWAGPIIFVSAALLSQDPGAVAVALNVISNYLTDFSKGFPGNHKVKLDIVVEQTRGKKSKRIHYDGDAAGLSQLSKMVREVMDNE